MLPLFEPGDADDHKDPSDDYCAIPGDVPGQAPKPSCAKVVREPTPKIPDVYLLHLALAKVSDIAGHDPDLALP